MPEAHLPPSAEVQREEGLAFCRDCGCPRCEAILAIERALSSDCQPIDMAAFVVSLGTAQQVAYTLLLKMVGGA